MASQYHQKMRDYIGDYGKTLTTVSNVNKSGSTPIAIPHPYPRARAIPVYYDPDVYYIKKRTGKYVIFEIADEQSVTETIADIVEAYLCPFRILTLFFIVPTNYKRDKHKNAASIILITLRKKLNLKKLPVEVRVVKISKKKRYHKKSIFKILDGEVKSVI